MSLINEALADAVDDRLFRLPPHRVPSGRVSHHAIEETIVLVARLSDLLFAKLEAGLR